MDTLWCMVLMWKFVFYLKTKNKNWKAKILALQKRKVLIVMNHAATDNSSEIALIERAKSNDEEAFRLLYDKYSPKLYSFIRSNLTKDDDEAKDVFSITLRKVVQKLNTFETDKPSAFYSWLVEIAKNTYIDECRQKKRVRFVTIEALENCETKLLWQRTEEYVLTKLEVLRLIEIIDIKLSIAQQRVVKLRIFGEMEFPEIANYLQISSIGTVQSHYLRGIKKLREVLELESNFDSSFRQGAKNENSTKLQKGRAKPKTPQIY